MPAQFNIYLHNYFIITTSCNTVLCHQVVYCFENSTIDKNMQAVWLELSHLKAII